jgi:hypothetical protein
MSKNIKIGLLLGLIAGIVDVIPMVLQKLTWDANLSAFSMWIVIGFLLSVTEIKIKGILKGIFLAFLVLIPNLFIIGWKEPFSLIPIGVMTLILGGFLGFFYEKLIK